MDINTKEKVKEVFFLNTRAFYFIFFFNKMFYSISQQGNICEVKEVNATVDLSCYYYFIIVMLCCEIVVYWRCTGPIV